MCRRFRDEFRKGLVRRVTQSKEETRGWRVDPGSVHTSDRSGVGKGWSEIHRGPVPDTEEGVPGVSNEGPRGRVSSPHLSDSVITSPLGPKETS